VNPKLHQGRFGENRATFPRPRLTRRSIRFLVLLIIHSSLLHTKISARLNYGSAALTHQSPLYTSNISFRMSADYYGNGLVNSHHCIYLYSETIRFKINNLRPDLLSL
jgi:hypothetical protein